MSEQFLAEASVLISPDLTAFRAKLLAELEAATRTIPPVVAPVRAADTATASRTRSLAAETAALGQVAGATEKLNTERRAADVVARRIAAAEQALVAARTVDVGASSAVAAAQIRSTAAKAANTAATKALELAERRGTQAEIEAARAVAVLTAALRADTVEKLRNARATEVAASRQAALAKGAAAQALGFAGLRGAVLAARPAFLAGTVAAIAFGLAIKTAADLESELAVFRVTADATGDEMERVAAHARELGADLTLPAVSAGDAAQAMTELAKAGLSIEDSIAGARGVLQLATAAQISNAEATELAANALNAYGLAGDQAVHVADVLANAANAAQGSIVDFGQALAQSSAVARQVGLSLEDTTALLTLFARNGLRGSDAGTALRTSLIRLIAPTERAQGIINDLDLKIRDLNGNVRADVFAQFGKATADLGPEVRDAAAAMIFGQDAIRAVAIAAREGTSGLRAAQGEIGQTGTAAEVAGARMEGLSGAARGLGSNLETLGSTIGTFVLPATTSLTRGVSSLVGGLNSALIATDSFGDNLLEMGTKGAAAAPGLQKVLDIFQLLNRVEIDPFTFDPAEIFSLAAGPPKTIEEIREAFEDVGLSAEEQRAKFVGLFSALIAGAQASKAALKQQGLPTEAIDRQIEDLRARLDAVQQGIFVDTGEPPPTQAELALRSLRQQIETFQTLGLPTEELKRSQAELVASIRATQGQFNRALREGVDVADESASRITDLLRQARANAEHLSPTDPLAPAARKSIQAVVEELKKLGPEGAKALKEAGELLQASFKVNVTDGLIAAAELGVAQAASAGGATVQTSALRALEQAQQKAVDDAEFLLRAAGGTAAVKAGKPLAVRRAAELTEAINALEATRAQISGVQDKVVADAKAAKAEVEGKAREAQTAREQADQALLDSFAPAQNRLDISAITSRTTESLRDDIALQLAIARQAGLEIAEIDKTIKNMKTRNAEIAKRVEIIESAAAEAGRLRTQVAEKATEDRRSAADVLTESLGKAVTLAGLRENKDAELTAINRAIANARRRVRNYEKLGTTLVDEQIALEQLINQRDEIEKTKKEGDQGTTAFDLLQQAAATFNASAGNLIGGNQPFAGPTGFTADLAQFLRRQQPSAAQPFEQRFPGKAADDKLVVSQNELVAAIRENTQALLGTGGNQTTGAVNKGVGSILRNDRRFYESRVTRSQVDADTGGGI